MSLYGAYYRLSDQKLSGMAHAVHSSRILGGSTKHQFKERPGKVYLKYQPAMFTAIDFECSLKSMCEHYGLKPADSFRKSSMSQHYEIMGELRGFYNLKFIPLAAFENTLEFIRKNSDVLTYDDRPGQTYLWFRPKDAVSVDTVSIEDALKMVCDYHDFEYSNSFRQSSKSPHLYEIKGELLELYKLKFSPEAAAQDSALADCSSPKIKCR